MPCEQQGRGSQGEEGLDKKSDKEERVHGIKGFVQKVTQVFPPPYSYVGRSSLKSYIIEGGRVKFFTLSFPKNVLCLLSTL